MIYASTGLQEAAANPKSAKSLQPHQGPSVNTTALDIDATSVVELGFVSMIVRRRGMVLVVSLFIQSHLLLYAMNIDVHYATGH